MMTVVAIAATFMGLSVGLLGSGGSILAVPLLVYIVGMAPKDAIATSLLIVGAASAVAAVQHGRSGAVRWKVGAVFGGVAMVGAYAGGLAAQFVSGTMLLLLFAAMMVAAGVAMLRAQNKTDQSTEGSGELSLGKAAIEGLVVGAVTGLVGAGGGFLVVPALVLLGGLDMRSAVGTSTLVVAMKSFAGFAGHASHARIDYPFAALVTGFAILGVLIGAAMMRRVTPQKLQRSFGAFVLVVAAVMFFQETTPDIRHALFVERWPFWAGGLAIGLLVLGLLGYTGKALGVSSGFYDVCALPVDPDARKSWRLPFIVGIIAGGTLAALAAGPLSPTTSMGLFDTMLSSALPIKIAVFGGGGVLLGLGARMAGGCTSGHGIVGVSILARSSLTATAIFMATGIVVTNFLMYTLGG